jgi:hypothetical protein
MAVGHGIALIGLGAWPVVSMRTFERVTGPKHDDWLVRTVGGLCIAIGTGLVAGRDRPTVVRPLGIASAATFLVADVIGYRSGRLRAVYLLDAVAEGALISGWVVASVPAAIPQVRHVARGIGRRVSRLAAPAMDGRLEAIAELSDPAQMRAHVRALLDEAHHVVTQTWPRSEPPTSIKEALRRLERAAERLDSAVAESDGPVDAAEIRRLAKLAAAATDDAASIQESAFLISS